MAKGMRVKTVRYCQRARKVSFATELDAKMALASRVHQDKGEIRYYECQFAPKHEPHFHLTSAYSKGEKH